VTAELFVILPVIAFWPLTAVTTVFGEYRISRLCSLDNFSVSYHSYAYCAPSC